MKANSLDKCQIIGLYTWNYNVYKNHYRIYPFNVKIRKCKGAKIPNF